MNFGSLLPGGFGAFFLQRSNTIVFTTIRTGESDNPNFGEFTPLQDTSYTDVLGSYDNTPLGTPVFFKFYEIRDTGGNTGRFSGRFCFSVEQSDCAAVTVNTPQTFALLLLGFLMLGASRKKPGTDHVFFLKRGLSPVLPGRSSLLKRFLAVALLLTLSSNSLAMPVFSDDGRHLTNVNVNGQLYDFTFEDGVLGDFYAFEQVSAPGWFELTVAVGQGLIDALNSLDRALTGVDIFGCSAHAGRLFIPADSCLMLLPQETAAPGETLFFASMLPAYQGSNAFASFFSVPFSAGVRASLDTSEDSVTGRGYTIVTFKPAATVPVPSTLLLVAFSLMLLGKTGDRPRFFFKKTWSVPGFSASPPT
jgi:hypothetical protein